MELGLRNKVALVTGASRGIGQGIAMSLAEEGCDLMLTGRDEEALKGVAADVAKKGRKAAISVLDLRKEGSEKPLVEAVRKEFGRLDILVNNAGATKRGDFFQLTDADWQDGFALKFFAHVRLTREAWPLLKAQKGSLVTIAGIGGKEPEPPFTIGSSVNAACVAFTKALSDIGKADGVQVNTIHPGRVETERLWRRFRETMEKTKRDEAAVREEFRQEFGISRFGKVEDIGSLIAFLVSPHGRWLHGTTIDIDGGEVRGI
jgi:NAD(P)-dependent dehydrogenase (short-subunit alcohol dehydrogenase family)